jgi:hypothetical protein
MSEIVEHLKLIQGVINRMAQVSFIIKGWSLTLSVAIIGFSVSASNGWFGFVGIVPILIFWGLDAYYLRQERLFRKLYKKVLKHDGDIESLTMDTKPCEDINTSWFVTLRRPTVLYLYMIIIVMMIVASLVILFSTNGGGNNGT